MNERKKKDSRWKAMSSQATIPFLLKEREREVKREER